MSDAQYGLSGVGRSGAMLSGYTAHGVLTQVGRYYAPALSGVGRSGAMLSGMTDAAASLRHIDNLRIALTGQRENPECTFEVVCTPATAPAEGDPVVIAVGTLQAPIFRGTLTRTELTYLAPDRLKVTCTAVGLLRDLARRTISGAWTNAYAGDILIDLLATYAPHLRTDGYVERGVSVASFAAMNEVLGDVCARLAAVCGYLFYIAPTRHVHFHTPDTLAAPWAIDSAEHYGNLKIRRESATLRTRIIVNYSQVQARTDTFVGDGATKEFLLSTTPHEITALTLNGAAVTFDTAYATDNSANEFSLDYTRGIVKTMAHDVLTASDTLICAYAAKVPAQITVNDSAAQMERQRVEGSDGLYDYVITDRDGLLSRADALSAAEAQLDQYAYAQVSATYTRVEDLQGILSRSLQPGQRQTLAQWGVAAPLEIQRVNISVLRPADDASLRWQLEVELGAPAERLDTALTASTTTTTTNEIEETIIR